MSTPELAKDPAAFINHLNRQLDSLIRFRATLDADDGSGAATDPTGAVTVEFAPGGTLQSIDVAPTWETHIEAANLVDVVNETLRRARDGEGTTPQPAGLSDEDVAAIRERRLAERRRAMSQQRSPEELQQLVDELPKQFDQLNASVRDMLARADEFRLEISDEEVPVETESVHSANKMVSVELSSGLVVGVAIHPTWLPGKSGNVITQCFDEIITALPNTAAENSQ